MYDDGTFHYGRGIKPSVSTQLRYNEYYDLQGTFDNLYERSKANALNGYNLYGKIINRNNILLAYRTIKSNTGSKTAGTDGITIEELKEKTDNELVRTIQNYLIDYKPGSVRRVDIPKQSGGTRPLGIPTMMDRLVQQMFKQVLEPICEAKFYNHSYGFRPNRGAKHAVARCQHLINNNNLHYVVDIDVKGFFDNVCHTKLMKQLYTVGVKDRRVLSIISKMLKAPIKGEGIPIKGTPQGGILSPLLSNVVLNDLDQWISGQWENFETERKYGVQRSKILSLKKFTELKEMYIVRYADDFKVFTRDHKTAYKVFQAVKGYLKNHLGLSISPEKSKVTNLRKNRTNFLGFELKAVIKRNKRVANTHIEQRKKEEIIKKARNLIKKIQKNPTVKTVHNYNSYVIGIKNYFKYATHVHKDLVEINYHISQTLYNRLKQIGKYGVPIKPSKLYKDYNKNNMKTHTVKEIDLHIMADVQTKNNMNFSQNICNYTKEGRIGYAKMKPSITREIQRMIEGIHESQPVEYIDNRLSKYTMQRGLCNVTGNFLYSEYVHCHHIVPKILGGTDEFNNLVIVTNEVHRLIHATTKEAIERYLGILQLTGKQLEKVNKYRKKCNLLSI